MKTPEQIMQEAMLADVQEKMGVIGKVLAMPETQAILLHYYTLIITHAVISNPGNANKDATELAKTIKAIANKI